MTGGKMSQTPSVHQRGTEFLPHVQLESDSPAGEDGWMQMTAQTSVCCRGEGRGVGQYGRLDTYIFFCCPLSPHHKNQKG